MEKEGAFLPPSTPKKGLKKTYQQLLRYVKVYFVPVNDLW